MFGIPANLDSNALTLYMLGSLLFIVEVAVIMLWVAFSIFQLVQPAVAVIETENFVLFSIYPFFTTPASIVSVLQELVVDTSG
jgi:hypothetical protein